MTRSEIIAEHLATLRASVAGGEEDHAHIAFKRVVYAALATPGCEAQGVRLVDLPHLAERVAEMADAHERVVGERDAARAALAKEEHAHGATLDRYGQANEWADTLANQIASAAGHDIGEHTNLNNPWDNAQDALEKLVKERDALRAERDEARGEVATLRAQVTDLTDPDNRLRALLDWRGVTVPCKVCFGSGRRSYANSATWRGGGGGQMMTDDVCDACWGSGDAERPGMDLRALTRHGASIHKAANEARRAERMDTLACGSNLVNEYLAKNGGGGDYCNALHRLIGMVACGAHEGAHEGAATPK